MFQCPLLIEEIDEIDDVSTKTCCSISDGYYIEILSLRFLLTISHSVFADTLPGLSTIHRKFKPVCKATF